MKQTLPIIAAMLLQFDAAFLWAGRLDGPHLTPASVTTSRIADSAVETAKLASDAVTASKLASDAASLFKVTGGAATSDGTNIGIGNTNPTSILEIESDTPQVIIRNTNSNGTGEVRFLEDTTTKALVEYVGSTLPTFLDRRNDLELFSFEADISFFPGGIQEVAFKSGGNVGLGTVNPSGKLHISSGTLLIDGDAATSFRIGTSSLIVTSNGNVGIGTTNPQSAINLEGINPPLLRIGTEVSGSFTYAFPDFDVLSLAANSTGGNGREIILSNADDTFSFPALFFRGFRGTLESPLATVGGEAIGVISGAGFDGTSFTGSKVNMVFRPAETFTPTAQGTFIQFRNTKIGTTVRREVMRIADTGNVGIGTNAPGATLDVEPEDFDEFTLQISSQNGTAVMVVDKAGNVGIGTTDPEANLHVSGASGNALIISSGSALSQRLWTFEAAGDLLPGTSAQQNIGSPSAPINEIFVGEQSIQFVDTSGVVTSSLSISGAGALQFGGITVVDSSGDLDIEASELPADGYASTYVNVPGDTMTGTLTLSPASGDALVTTAGKVGIGISNPFSISHIKGNTPGTVGDSPALQLIIQHPSTDVNLANAGITLYSSDVLGNPDKQLGYFGSSSGSNQNITLLNRRNATLTLGTNGVTRLTVDNNGDVGIGIAVPGAKLDIAGNIKIADGTQAPGKVLTSDAAGLANWSTVVTAGITDGAVTNAKLLTDSGSMLKVSGGAMFSDGANIGIGTTNPTAIFQVRDKPLEPGLLTAETNAGALIKSLTNNGGDTPSSPESALILARDGVASQAFANFARFDLSRFENVATNSRTQLDFRLSNGVLLTEGNNTPTIMSLRSNGNVGIGTTGPGAQLELSNTAVGVDFIVNTSTFVVKDGLVGIGTASPGRRLTIQTLAAGDAIAFRDDTGTTEWHMKLQGTGLADLGFTETGVADNRLVLEAGGDIGIGVSNPTIALAIFDSDTGLNQNGDGVLDITANGTVAASAKTDGANIRFFVPNVDDDAAENDLCRAATGEVSRSSTGCATSSRRYKHNIQDLKYGLEEVMRLRPVTWEKNSDPDRTEFGMVAEEVAEIFPEIIGYEPQATLIKNYDRRGMHAVLIKAIQEQQKQIEELKHQLMLLKE